MRQVPLTALTGAAALAAGPSGTAALSETTLNGQFMAQAAYCEAELRAMTEAHLTAHSDVTVNLEFVPYQGLRDKTLLAPGSGSGDDMVPFDVIWPAETATMASRST